MSSSIFKSIFITAATLITVVCIAVSVAAYTSCNDSLHDGLRAECGAVLVDMGSEGIPYVQAKYGASGLLVISQEGQIICGSDENFTEVISSRTSGIDFERGFIGNKHALFCIMTDAGGASVYGYADVAVAMAPFYDVLYLSIFSLTFSLAVAFLAALLLSRRIVKPLYELGVERHRGEPKYPELKPLSDKLNSQSYKISQQLSQLRERAYELESITSNMSEGMIVINANAEVLSCNGAAKSILGVSRELPRGVLSIRNTQQFRDAVFSALNGKNGYDSIVTEDKFYSILVTPVTNDFGIAGAVIMIIDDTEKEHREMLRREFTSNISHELKTPLTSISGFAELIRDGIASEEDSRRFAANIHKEAARLIVLVGDIIKISMLDGGEVSCDERVDLLAVCQSVVHRLSNVAEAAGVTVSATGENLTIKANELIVEEMIYNLADNGIKYNERGGYVTISVGEDRGDAVVSVKDNGIGIPADKQDRVFERFYRVDKSHSKSIGGTGLGLSIVKHAAMRHGAKINLSSELGVGTSIDVRFPTLLNNDHV